VERVRNELDCIENARGRLLKLSWATEQELKQIEKEVKKQIDDDVETAKAAPEPSVPDLWADLEADAPPPFIRLVDVASSIRNTSSS